jgi:hypothetical protein
MNRDWPKLRTPTDHFASARHAAELTKLLEGPLLISLIKVNHRNHRSVDPADGSMRS